MSYLEIKIKNSLFTFLVTIVGITLMNAQRTTSEESKHATYGTATIKSFYDENDVLTQKMIYTKDTLLTKGNEEIGEVIYYYENGNIQAKGNFIGVNKARFFGASLSRDKYGAWSFFNKEGTLAGTINYQDDREEGAYTYYHANGKISHSGNNTKGNNDGVEKAFFYNGQLHRSVKYIKGKVDNVLSFYDIHGNKIDHGTLKDGQGTLNVFDLETGKLKKTSTIENGVVHNIEISIQKTDNGDIIEKKYRYNDTIVEKIVRMRNDTLEGLQEFFNTEGILIESVNYKKGLKNGKHIKLDEDGLLFYEYTYKNDKKNGPYKYTPEGFKDTFYVLEEGTYDENQKLTGDFKQYLQDKKKVLTLGKMDGSKILIKSGTYNQGRKIGVWQIFDSKGILVEKTDYSEQKEGLYVNKEFFENSKKVSSIIEYDKKTSTGFEKTFYINGQLKSLTNFKEEIADGPYEEYYQNGQLKTIGQRKNGDKIGNWKEFKKNGLILHDHMYSGGCCFPSKRIDYYYNKQGGKLSSIIIQDHKKKNPLNENESYFETTITKDFWDNGELRELQTKRKYNYKSYNVKEGPYQRFDRDGHTEVEGVYKNDKEEGIWKYYDYYHRLRDKKTYVSGNKRGPFEEYKYYDDTTVVEKKYEGVAYEDKMEQTITYFYNTGNIKQTGKYIHTYKEQFRGRIGLWKAFYENGKLKEEGMYEKGKKVGVWKQYNKKGRISDRTKY
ncbi:hypothetical protein GCM10022393_19110 [Aquimarina addita]|uniref:Toxin-antitoxin system YwqK family antitoxin n=1 Tax=Aquimarina addita TaxID=870485 RepID=A0ABP6UHJ9_9FLAO